MNNKDDKFYLNIIYKLLNVLGPQWRLSYEHRNEQNRWFFLDVNSYTFASALSSLELIESFIENTKYSFHKHLIPDFLKVSSIEELIVQLDLHCD